jgi:hypothetical protein
MEWRDRLRAALAREAAVASPAKCAGANCVNSANCSGEVRYSGQLAQMAQSAPQHSPQNAPPGHGSTSAVPPTVISPLPTGAAKLLGYLRDVLHCRVTLEGGVVTIRPTHRCPPDVVAAALAAEGGLRAILQDEARSTPIYG